MLNWAETQGNRELYLVDYVKLYIDTIRARVWCTECPLIVRMIQHGPQSSLVALIRQTTVYERSFLALCPRTGFPTEPGATHSQVNRLDPSGVFVDSSPSNGIVAREPYVKAWGSPNDPTRGDRHYYNVNADCMVCAICVRDASL